MLRNKVMVGTVNGNREYFEAASAIWRWRRRSSGLGRAPADAPSAGLENFRQLIDTLTSGRDVIKAFCEIAPLDTPTGAAPSSELVSAMSAD